MSFLRSDRPVIVGMLRSNCVEELLKEIAQMLQEGVDCFGFQIEILNPKERTLENFQKLFAAMRRKPVYVTNYIRCNPVEHTDEELMEELYLAAECGASLIDVRGDLFDRQPGEFTEDKEAVKKQCEVIQKLKAMGVEVLMSTHVLRYIPGAEVLKIALEQQKRGADIVKIVTDANSEEELMEHFKTSILLKEKVHTPNLFLCNGTHCKKHRILAPALGGAMFLAVENGYVGQNQPTIREVRRLLTLAGYTDLPQAVMDENDHMRGETHE